MAATDCQIVVAAARWTEEGQYLREFVAKNKLPASVKIIKGHYAGMGVPTLPSPGLHSTALIVSAGKRHKILAQAIKIKEGRRIVSVGPRFAIPGTYNGYFELLSEEGRAMRCIESVAELSRRRPENGCLVRDSIRGIVGKYDADNNLTADGARIINAGEILFPQTTEQLGYSRVKVLRCLDSAGDIVLLSLDQKGRFSALAKEDNISGVHTAKNLLTKRLPITVRLVHGAPPRGLKNPNHFVPELRLLSTYEEEHVFAMPLQKDSNSVIALPLATPLKLQKAKNEDHLKDLREYQRLVDKCTKLVSEVADQAHVFDGKLSADWKALRLLSSGGNIIPSKNGCFLRRSMSSDSANHYINYSGGISHSHNNSENRLHGLLSDEYDEIDQIYDYVRGFAPLPKNIRSPFADSDATPIITNSHITNNGHNPSQSHSHNNVHIHAIVKSHGNSSNNNINNNKIKINNIKDDNIVNKDDHGANDTEESNKNNISHSNNKVYENNVDAIHSKPDVVRTASNFTNVKPEPPPIETIPTKKLPTAVACTSVPAILAEKKGRRSNAKETVASDVVDQAILSSPAIDKFSNNALKLYIKNNYPQNRRLLRQKSSSPRKEHPPLLKSGSPIFDIRYKSLNNLQAMELDGTLDSSHSGGKTSGDSGTGAKLPEKRSKRLSRPRSLTNLVWEIRNEIESGNCERKNKPVKLEPTIQKKCNAHKIITPNQKRIGTLYL